MFEVIYYSRSGNTKKVAEAIATELKVQARDVKTRPCIKKNSFVVLGSGCYLTQIGKEMTEFIKNNDFSGRQVAIFGTSGSGLGIEVSDLQGLLRDKGAIISGKFYCRGKAFFIGAGHPTNKDLQEAREFARQLTKVEYGEELEAGYEKKLQSQNQIAYQPVRVRDLIDNSFRIKGN